MSATAVDYRAVIADLERQRDEHESQRVHHESERDALMAVIEHLGRRLRALPIVDGDEPRAEAIAETQSSQDLAAEPESADAPVTVSAPTPRVQRYTPEERDAFDRIVLAAMTADPAGSSAIAKRVFGNDRPLPRNVSRVSDTLYRLLRAKQIERERSAFRLPKAAPGTKARDVNPPEAPVFHVSVPTTIKTVSASGVALRQPEPAPKFKPGDQPWWTKTKPGEMTAAATQRQEEMSASREGRRISGASGLERG